MKILKITSGERRKKYKEEEINRDAQSQKKRKGDREKKQRGTSCKERKK